MCIPPDAVYCKDFSVLQKILVENTLLLTNLPEIWIRLRVVEIVVVQLGTWTNQFQKSMLMTVLYDHNLFINMQFCALSLWRFILYLTHAVVKVRDENEVKH